MISQPVKDIINASPVKDQLIIDDDNNIIGGKCVTIRMNSGTSNISGQIEFYLFGIAFTGTVYFVDVDSVSLEPDPQQGRKLDAIDIVTAINSDASLSPELIKFFHIKLKLELMRGLSSY